MSDSNDKKRIPNRLIYETSPYLLQHAYNPVAWFAWGEEAFAKAQRENKPILVSIGYSTCHWCHVMERESFENEEVAAFMNKYFINIKVDREERPDVDSIYMEVAQAVTGSGGWPLNCVLLPDGRPFFGGTYYPPKPAYNRASWVQVLNNLLNAFHNRKEEVEKQATLLTELIEKSDTHFVSNLTLDEKETPFTRQLIEETFYKLRENFDGAEGGFGNAPKFPSVMALRFSMNYHYYTGHKDGLEHTNLSLQKMIRGGMYDQLGGGFARYSVDREWLVPHFEKMLYDNALLVGLLADAYTYTKEVIYKETIEETLTWVEREMTNPEGGFYSALDADSEGVEGKYYVWSKAEIEQILGDEADLFMRFYDVTEEGNWEHTNILHRDKSFERFAEEEGIVVEELKQKMAKNRAQLHAVQAKRIRPGLDDKSLIDWNSMMITAYCQAYRALQNEAYKNQAIRAAQFIKKRLAKAENFPTIQHSYKDNATKYEAYLDGYALWIEALLGLYSITFDEAYLREAERYTDYVLEAFLDEDKKLFYFTPEGHEKLIVRKRDLYDNATPSGNSTMVHNLLTLGTILSKSSYKEQAERNLLAMVESASRFPQSFANWALGMMRLVYPQYELAVVGDDYVTKAMTAYQYFIPDVQVVAGKEENLELLKGRYQADKTQYYLCRDYACQLPQDTMDKVYEQLHA